MIGKWKGKGIVGFKNGFINSKTHSIEWNGG
jgi:hypothetical protein